MKKRFFAAILSLILVFPAVLFVSAEKYELSTGFSVLLSKSQLKKCGVKNLPVCFSAQDFERVLGKGDYLTFLSLPDKELGRLMLCGTEIKKGQSISRKSASSLIFEPAHDAMGSAVFAFSETPDSRKHGLCTIFVLETENLSPKAHETPFDTIKNISYSGFLSASDPDGDELTFIITTSPKHGTLKMLDEKSGNIMYTPKTDFTGRDTFKFKVCDKYGNFSDICRVVVHVNEKPTDTVFADMTNHWAHESAICAFDDNVMSAKNEEGKLVFCPEEGITRGDFLAVAMIAAGLESKVTRCLATPFSDDENIPLNIKSYAAAAYEMGIIKGYPTNSGAKLESEKFITRKEASVILSRILALENDGESNTVTVAAQPSVDLSAAGIMVGAGCGQMLPDRVVTRAQLAKIYCNLKEYAAAFPEGNAAKQ